MWTVIEILYMEVSNKLLLYKKYSPVLIKKSNLMEGYIINETETV